MYKWQWCSIWVGALIAVNAYANDSTGFVETGGVEYLHNPKIAMQSEDLFMSKKQIRVAYQFKNLTDQDIEETVLFPLPRVGSARESDFADTEGLIQSFQIRQQGKPVQPKTHVRAFLPDMRQSKHDSADYPLIDVTSELKACGLSEMDLMYPWMQNQDVKKISQKMLQCTNPKIQQLLQSYQQDDEVYWEAQVVYSWQQRFKAHAITHIQHQYQPLVGGSVALYPEQDEKTYCMDATFKAGLNKAKAQQAPYQALGYILTTGANWAKPIADFKLTIERDVGELVSFCWEGKVQKISSTRFEIRKKNFVPKQDLNIIFVNTKFRFE